VGEAEEFAWFIVGLNEDIRPTKAGEGIDQGLKEIREIVRGSL
jgi:hypothetical protein